MAQYSSAILRFGVLDCRLFERIVFRSLFSLQRHLRLSSKQRPFWGHCWHFPALWCLGLTQASPSSKNPLPASSTEGYCVPCKCITPASLLVLHLSLLKIASFPFFSVERTVFEDSGETQLSTNLYVYYALLHQHPKYTKAIFAKIRLHRVTVQGASALDKLPIKSQQAWALSIKRFWTSWGHHLKTKGKWAIYFWDLILKTKTKLNTSLESVSNLNNPIPEKNNKNEKSHRLQELEIFSLGEEKRVNKMNITT